MICSGVMPSSKNKKTLLYDQDYFLVFYYENLVEIGCMTREEGYTLS